MFQSTAIIFYEICGKLLQKKIFLKLFFYFLENNFQKKLLIFNLQKIFDTKFFLPAKNLYRIFFFKIHKTKNRLSEDKRFPV